MTCKPPICPKIGLSLVTIIELTANQSRIPLGNGTSAPAAIVETARSESKAPVRPRAVRQKTPTSLRCMRTPEGSDRETDDKLAPRQNVAQGTARWQRSARSESGRRRRQRKNDRGLRSSTKPADLA